MKAAATLPELQVLVTRLVRRALEDLDVSVSSLASRLHRSKASVQRWLDEDDEQRQMPLWVLADRGAMSDALFERMVADLRSERERQGAPPVASLERVLAGALRAMGEVITRGVAALEDGQLSPDERADLRPLVVVVDKWCSRWLREDSAVRVG